MLSSDDLQMIRAVVRQELTGLLHPSVQRLPAPVPANDSNANQPDQPPPNAA